MALKDLISTDKDRVTDLNRKISELRNLLRDVYDVASSGHTISEGLLSRIRRQMASGR